MDLQSALYSILMSEKFQQVRIKILPETDFTLNGRVFDFMFTLFKSELAKTYENDPTFPY